MRHEIKDHVQSTGPGTIRDVEFTNVHFTSITRTHFESCTFTNCTTNSSKFALFKHCKGEPKIKTSGKPS